MAEVKLARVVSTTALADDTRAIVLEMHSPSALGFRGGQYVIVDSGSLLPNGKAAKRAYSIASGDDEQQRIELVVMRLPHGQVSNYMHALEVGAELRFSGPWGKLLAPEAGGAATLVLATDTGITAALALLRSQRFRASCATTRLVWLRSTPAYFVPESWVRARLPPELPATSISISTLPPIGDPARIAFALGVLRELFGRSMPERAFACGDGLVNYALLDDWSARGVPISRDDVESFFNMPKKSG